jgi:hypothetical protein
MTMKLWTGHESVTDGRSNILALGAIFFAIFFVFLRATSP